MRPAAILTDAIANSRNSRRIAIFFATFDDRDTLEFAHRNLLEVKLAGYSLTPPPSREETTRHPPDFRAWRSPRPKKSPA
jgi:hypothetical protein